MLSIAKAHKDYYLQKLGEITPREDYYLRGGTATGRWHGSGANEQGLRGTVSAGGLVRLFDGQHPATGEQLGRQLRRDGVAAWDLTFSADKSVSLLWAFGDDETRRHVVEAFEEASTEAVAYLESVASSTRGASRIPILDRNGNQVLGEDGTPRQRIETWPIRTTGYVAAWFTEFTSRADDPQLHAHVVVGNRVKGVDGVWRAIDGRLLYRHKLAAGYLHEAELRSRLTERLGVRWQPVHNGVADIEGFTRDQIMAFSQRRQQIDAWRTSHGLADTAAANEVATLATRGPKQDHSLNDLLDMWLERGAAVGVTPERVSAVIDHSREMTVPDPEPVFDRLASAKGLTAQASTFGRADVIKATAEALLEGGRRGQVEALADSFLRRSDVVPILPTQPGSDWLRNLPVELDPTELERIRELANAITPTMRRRDGDIFPGLIHERRYTTTELLAVEQRIIDRAQNGITAQRWTAPETQVEAALADQPKITNGQQAMVRQFATSGSSVDIGVGAAGTGKTTVMAIINELARLTGTPIVGAALAARAAAGFETATGIPSATLTRLLWEIKSAGGLPTGAIVVVDESGMVSTRQLGEVSDVVDAANGKLILIGDHHQLAEIDAGGLFAALTARLPAVELTENVRQDHEWERTALAELRHGSISRALAMYDRRGIIRVAANTNDAICEAVDAWHRDVQDLGDPSQVLLIGHRNTTVSQLNRRARAVMREAGLLDGPAINAGDREFQAGDRAVCLKNRTRLGVLNGDVAIVTAIDTEHRTVTLRLDRTNQCVTVPHWYLDAGHLDWGYAITGHKAQGATATRTHTVADDGIDREWIYVTMSRGREANTLYLTDPDVDEAQCRHVSHQHPDRLSALIAALGRTTAEPAAIDTGRGPRMLTYEQVVQRLDEIESRLEGREDRLATQQAIGNRGALLAEYVILRREEAARHRDRLAAVSYQPPGWIIGTLGERPSAPGSRAVWDTIVDRAVRYRVDHGIPDEAPGLLGREPLIEDIEQRVAWLVARQGIERCRQRGVREHDSVGLPLR